MDHGPSESSERLGAEAQRQARTREQRTRYRAAHRIRDSSPLDPRRTKAIQNRRSRQRETALVKKRAQSRWREKSAWLMKRRNG